MKGRGWRVRSGELKKSYELAIFIPLFMEKKWKFLRGSVACLR